MMSRLRPTQVIESVLDLDLSQLQSMGKRALIFDLDNTLCRRGAKRLDADVSGYITAVRLAGFDVGILTNRRRNANDPLVQDLRKQVSLVTAAKKPRRAGYVKIMHLMGVSSQAAVMIGDKRFTDIWGANRVGIHSIRVRTHPCFTRS